MGWQTPLLQRPEPQSPLPVHILPLLHFGQLRPPQSTSVSVPFLTPSEQLGAWHLPTVHTLLWQSEPLVHILPDGHAGHVPPPQSMSVSMPFLTPSVQVGAGMFWQTPPVQKPELQSPFPVHILPAPHFPQVGPPQSTSVSAPFLTPSEQLGA
jgi:hypothetical protein